MAARFLVSKKQSQLSGGAELEEDITIVRQKSSTLVSLYSKANTAVRGQKVSPPTSTGMVKQKSSPALHLAARASASIKLLTKRSTHPLVHEEDEHGSGGLNDEFLRVQMTQRRDAESISAHNSFKTREEKEEEEMLLLVF